MEGYDCFLSIYGLNFCFFQGGETRFPMAQDPPPFPREQADRFYNKNACESGGLAVTPQKGKAILFYSLEEEGHMEVRTLL